MNLIDMQPPRPQTGIEIGRSPEGQVLVRLGGPEGTMLGMEPRQALALASALIAAAADSIPAAPPPPAPKIVIPNLNISPFVGGK